MKKKFDKWIHQWRDRPDAYRLWVSLVVLVLGIPIVWGSKGVITLDWQKMFRPGDFTTWSDYWQFMRHLQTGISPFWSSLEIFCQLLFGSVGLFVDFAYPLCLLLCGVLPVWWFTRKPGHSLLVGVMGLVFLVAVRFLHPGNAQLYDLYMPLLFMVFLHLLSKLRPPASEGHNSGTALGAGLSLAILELTRTLVFPFMPVLLGLSLVSMRGKGRRNVLLFLLPILLLSGGWHLKQWGSHGHLHWTNHGGFNLYNNWYQFVGEIEFEEAPPLYEGGFKNFNTDLHSQNNRKVQKLVLEGIKAKPGKAVVHFVYNIFRIFKPQTTLFGSDLGRYPFLAWAYRFLVWTAGLGMGLGLLWIFWRVSKKVFWKDGWTVLGDPLVIAVLGSAMMTVVIAQGELGEEPRFMISILPILIIFPIYRLRHRQNATPASCQRALG